jgi:hypothetical protein
VIARCIDAALAPLVGRRGAGLLHAALIERVVHRRPRVIRIARPVEQLLRLTSDDHDPLAAGPFALARWGVAHESGAPTSGASLA